MQFIKIRWHDSETRKKNFQNSYCIAKANGQSKTILKRKQCCSVTISDLKVYYNAVAKPSGCGGYRQWHRIEDSNPQSCRHSRPDQAVNSIHQKGEDPVQLGLEKLDINMRGIKFSSHFLFFTKHNSKWIKDSKVGQLLTYSFNPSTQEAETLKSLNSRPAWTTYQVQG